MVKAAPVRVAIAVDPSLQVTWVVVGSAETDAGSTAINASAKIGASIRNAFCLTKVNFLFHYTSYLPVNQASCYI